jgi:NADPH:quinone reductase-like Zn-dependent oxidoreductase
VPAQDSVLSVSSCLPLCVINCRCDEVVCSGTEDLAARVKSITGGAGAAAVIDSVGGALSQSLGAAVKDGGSVWLYGLMEGLTFTGSGVDCLFRWEARTRGDGQRQRGRN